MRKTLFHFTLLYLITGIRGSYLSPDYSLHFLEPKSAIGTKEDPNARANYETRMLLDPASGSIPFNIRKREVEFTKSLPTKLLRASTDARITINEYELAGPFNVGGRTRALALDVQDENTIVAGGVSGGIWKSTNGGTSWTRTSDPALRNSVTCLTQDPRAGKENIWYFGTGELLGNSARTPVSPFRGAGIYKSTDDGDSWSVLPSTSDEAQPDNFTSQFQYIWDIAVNHTNQQQDEVLTAAYGGILRSLDGGSTWQVMLGQKLFDLDPEETNLNDATAPFYTSLKKSPNGHFYAALSSATSTNDKLAESAGFYFSADGENWQSITPPGLPNYHERSVIGISSDESRIYYLTQGETDIHLWLLEVSEFTNGTINGTWQNLSSNIPAFGGNFGDLDTQGGYNMLIQVHPTEHEVVYIGGTNLYRSTDGYRTSANTKWIGGYNPANSGGIYPSHYPDQHLLVFYPSDPNRMICGNDGGLRLTTNNLADSVRYTTLNNGYVTSQFYAIAQRRDRDTNEIIGGMQDNGSYVRDAPGINPSWNKILSGDGGYCAITPDRDFFYASFQNGQIYRLILNDNNQLQAYTRVDPKGGGGTDGENYLFINPFILDPTNANRMFMTGGNRLWRNDNLLQIPGGSQNTTDVGWSRIKGTGFIDSVYTCLEKGIDEDILYAGVFSSYPAIKKITNASDPTSEISSVIKSDNFPRGGYIPCIAANPEDADEFLVIFSNYNVPSVFHTLDGGNTFTDISGNLEAGIDGTGYGPSVRWGEIIPTQSGYAYYLGTSTGLVSTTELKGADTEWLRESVDQIGNSVITMMDYRDVDGRLVIGTHGNGVFQTYIDDFRVFESNKPSVQKLLVDQNFPNPFQRSTSLRYSIPENDEVKIDIYNSQGQHMLNLLWGSQYAGTNYISWDGNNTSGTPVESGLYFCRIQYRDQVITKRMLYQP